MFRLDERIKELKEYNKIAKIDKIARRYFVMNSFDGVLAILGVLVGSFIVESDKRIALTTGLAAGIAMGISGVWGAYFTERAERQLEIKELEKATLSKLGATRIGRAATAAVMIIAIIDGVAPFLAVIIILLPFFTLGSVLTARQLYLTSITIGFFLLFVLGMFLGKLTKENIIKTGIIMTFAGLLSAVLSYLLLGRHHIIIG